MMMCGKCSRMMAWVMLILGLVFILNSYGIFFNFGASEWGVVLVVFGLCGIMGSGCPGCQQMQGRRR